MRKETAQINISEFHDFGHHSQDPSSGAYDAFCILNQELPRFIQDLDLSEPHKCPGKAGWPKLGCLT